jgi:hypothetical protein
MIKLFIAPEWAERLEKAGRNSLESCMKLEAGKVLSEQKRGKITRLTLEDGTTVFVKVDNFTFLRQTVKDLLHFRRPLSNTNHERLAYETLREQGFNVPEVVAWFASYRMGAPGAAAMITLPISGTPLERYLLTNIEDQVLSAKAVRRVEAEFRRMLELGHDWKRDHKPEHFFISDDLQHVAILDLERMVIKPRKLSRSLIGKRIAAFRRLASLYMKR